MLPEKNLWFGRFRADREGMGLRSALIAGELPRYRHVQCSASRVEALQDTAQTASGYLSGWHATRWHHWFLPGFRAMQSPASFNPEASPTAR